ncbi:MAG: substrate-binding domain-containing protein [Actinobacteria bacterium]|nr:substrate-binding domain-containing protein [Actinomycetota bacterium]
MKKFTSVLVIIALSLTVFAVVGCSANQKAAVKPSGSTEKPVNKGTVILATTTSTRDTGLLDILLPAFTKKTGITVIPVAVGTGEALKMGERGDVDVLLVHSRKSEDEFMAKGFGKVRKDVMHNDFVLIGPKNDPARTKEATSAAQAFGMIASKGAVFVSRGDDSGTHKKELKIWEKAEVKPAGAWYISTGQGMAATIRIADEKQGYTLADRGTYLVQKKNIDLAIVLEKKTDLLNPYGVIAVNPDKFPKVNYKGSMEFVDFIISTEGQEIIRDFGKDKYGEPLFMPDAKK